MSTASEKKEVAEEKEAEKVYQAELAKAADAKVASDKAAATAAGLPYTAPGTPRQSQHRTNELAAVQDLIKEVGFGNLSNEEIVVRLKRIELSIQTF